MANAVREKRDIEQLVVWALVAQGLGCDSGGGAPASNGMAQLMELGTVVSSSGVIASPSVSLFSDEDALVVATAIRALPPEMAGIVLQHGRASARPDWAPEGYGEPQPLRDKRGRPRVEYENPKARKGPCRVLMDQLAWSQRKSTVDFFRAGYRLWWRALELLVPAVNAHMTSHIATGPAAPKEPWLVPVPEADLPAAAAARVRAYGEGTGSPIGELSIKELAASAQAPLRERAMVWDEDGAGVPSVRREHAVADVARDALRRGLQTVDDSQEL